MRIQNPGLLLATLNDARDKDFNGHRTCAFVSRERATDDKTKLYREVDRISFFSC